MTHDSSALDALTAVEGPAFDELDAAESSAWAYFAVALDAASSTYDAAANAAAIAGLLTQGAVAAEKMTFVKDCEGERRKEKNW